MKLNKQVSNLVVDVVVLVDHVVGVLLAAFPYYVWKRNSRAGLRSKLEHEIKFSKTQYELSNQSNLK